MPSNSPTQGSGSRGFDLGSIFNMCRTGSEVASRATGGGKVDWMGIGMQLVQVAGPYVVQFIGAQPKPPKVDVDQAFQDAQNVTSTQPYEAPTYSGGNVRALLVGINYFGSSAELAGCINDVKQTLATFQKTQFPIRECNILVDDPKFPGVAGSPTRANIVKYFAWLVSGAKAGDVLYLHYSGHGSHTKSSKDSAEDQDQCLVPVDYEKAGCIIDDDIFDILAKDLPAGVRMTVLFDCCHSGSMLDLPYTFVAGSGMQRGGHMKQIRQTNFSKGDVLMISGCADTQTSADVANTASMGTGSTGAGGAATQCLTYTLLNTKNLSFESVLLEMRDQLKKRKFEQVPQLSSSKPINLNQEFTMSAQFAVDPAMARTLPTAYVR